MIGFKVDRGAVDEALSVALGRQVTSKIDSTPTMPTEAAPTQGWINMLQLFSEQVFRPNGLFTQPLVALPFVDSLVRGFLLASDHPHRRVFADEERLIAPRAIRAAIDFIEEEAHSPLTLSCIASRSHVSVRSLQYGFRSHLDMSPMDYLREVRLRRAHQDLVESDPSSDTVTSIAHRWGFANLGRFAATYSARYHEKPTDTLHRKRYNVA